MSLLDEIAAEDGVTVGEAAAYFAESGLTSVAEWAALGRPGRALTLGARRSARVNAMFDSGLRMEAAAAFSEIDGGRWAARLMAKAAAEGVVAALAETEKRARA